MVAAQGGVADFRQVLKTRGQQGESPNRYRRLGRAVAATLWFRVDGGWIYYVILGGYSAMVCGALWLLTRHWWLPIVAGFIVLLDGLTGLLVLLNRWVTRRSDAAR